jgi:hypothetical protein
LLKKKEKAELKKKKRRENHFFLGRRKKQTKTKDEKGKSKQVRWMKAARGVNGPPLCIFCGGKKQGPFLSFITRP